MALKITEVLYPRSRQEWRDWLLENHATGTEIWLRTPHMRSGLDRVPYDDCVEEAWCFGWIDGLVKKYDDVSAVQRYTPRRKKTYLSELNRQRMYKLMKLGLMTEAGIQPVEDQLGSADDPLIIPDDILMELQSDETVWENWQQFPIVYRKIRIGWVKECREKRFDESQKRLKNLIKKTADNKMFGTIVEMPE